MKLKTHPHNRLLQRLLRTERDFFGPVPIPVSFIIEKSEQKFVVRIPMPAIYCHGVAVALGHTWMLEVLDTRMKLLRITDKLAIYFIESGMTLRELVERFDEELFAAIKPQGTQLSRSLAFEAELEQMQELPYRELAQERTTLNALMNRTGFKPWEAKS